MPPVGFEPTILASDRPQTHALDRTATEIGIYPASVDKLLLTDKRGCAMTKYIFLYSIL
jgi:hypothetical protein